ncbi:MAG: hypothetical protein AAGM84_04150 [Pseudomonadota bacterium]
MSTTASLMITLRRRNPDGPHEVRTVEHTQDGVNQRMSFAQVRTTAGVFHPNLAVLVEDAARRMGNERSAISSPDTIVSLPGLVLGRMYVSTPGAVGMADRNVMVMFRSVVGAFRCAFLEDYGFDTATASLRDEIETKLLADIATPVLDLLTGLCDGSPPPSGASVLAARLERLSRDRDEIVFYLDMLKRYVQNEEHRARYIEREAELHDSGHLALNSVRSLAK